MEGNLPNYAPRWQSNARPSGSKSAIAVVELSI